MIKMAPKLIIWSIWAAVGPKWSFQTSLNNTLRGFGAFQASLNETPQGFGTFQVSFNNPFRGYGAFQASSNDPFRGYGAVQASFNNPFRGYGAFQGMGPSRTLQTTPSEGLPSIFQPGGDL